MSIEDLYRAIGRAAVDLTPERVGKLLVYSEVQEGMISSALFYDRGPDKRIAFQYSSHELDDLVVELWKKWKTVPGNLSWCRIAYLVQGNGMSIDLVYPDQVDEDEPLLERRSALLLKYFESDDVDYSLAD